MPDLSRIPSVLGDSDAGAKQVRPAPASGFAASAESPEPPKAPKTSKAAARFASGESFGATCPTDAGSPASSGSDDSRYARARLWFVRVWTLVGAVLLTGVVVYLLDVLSVPVSILIWTLIFVFCLRGIVNGLDARGVNRTLGTAVAYVVMFAVIGLVGFLMFSPMFGLNSQMADLVASVPHLVNDCIAWANDMYARYAPVLEDESVKSFIQDAQSSLATWASSFAQTSAAGLVNVSAAVANGLMAIGFALVIAFWVLMDLPAIGREASRLVGPKHAEDAEFLHYTFTRIMGGYIKATLLQCAVIGVACGVLFAVVGIPNAAALGGITGVLNIIPIIGPWLGGAAAAVTAVFVSPLAALVALVGTIIIQQFVYTFVSPRIMAGSVDIHPALTLIALMAGSALGGAMSGLLGALVGMLASIPAVAVLKACFVYYFEKRTGRHLVAADGVFFKGTPAEGEIPDPMADATSPNPGSTASFLPVELDEKGQPTGRLKRIRLGRHVGKGTHISEEDHDKH